MPHEPSLRVKEVIDAVTRQVTGRLPAARALILTGSTARGEATLISTAGGIQWLSDAEFLVVVKDMNELRAAPVRLMDLAAQIEDRLADAGVQVSVELTPAPEKYFRSIRPHLFAYELIRHGKQLCGTTDYLAQIPRFSRTEIPREDAWRLLSNRIVEWLSVLTETDALPLERQFYSLVKKYLDLTTSLSIFSAGYEASYRERAMAADRTAAWLEENLPELLDQGFLKASSIAADFKASPQTEAYDWLWKGTAVNLRSRLESVGWEWLYDRLPAMVTTAWRWELAQISERPVRNRGDALRALRSVQTWRSWLLGWGRIAARPWLRAGSVFFPRAPFLAPLGTPRNLVYICAEQLLEGHGKQDREMLSWVGRHLPAVFGDSREDWESLARQCIRNWRAFLRMTQT